MHEVHRSLHLKFAYYQSTIRALYCTVQYMHNVFDLDLSHDVLLSIIYCKFITFYAQYMHIDSRYSL